MQIGLYFYGLLMCLKVPLILSRDRRVEARAFLKAHAGFTLVELIIVLILIGVTAAVAVPRFLDQQTFGRRGFHDETFALLRYAQKTAIAQRRTVCINFGSDRVTLFIASAPGGGVTCSIGLAGPNGVTPYAAIAGAGISFSPAPTNFSFNALGQASVGQTLQVNGIAQTITVDRETGYVHH